MTQAEDPTAGLRADIGIQSNQAWRALYDEHFARMYRLVCRFGVLPADAEDVVQQVFVIAHRRIREIDQVRSVPAWLRGIAVRVVSDYHRWWRVRRVKQWIVETTHGGDAPTTPERATEQAQVQARVGAVLRRMPPKLRSVLVLCDIEECSVSEAAESLEIPVNTVRSRRRLARASFQGLWQQTEEDSR